MCISSQREQRACVESEKDKRYSAAITEADLRREAEKFHGEFGTLKRFSCEPRSAKTKFKGHSWTAAEPRGGR